MSSESDDVRVWLVERDYDNRDLIILTYATPDGTRTFRKELAAQAVDLDTVTAAKDVSPSDLATVDDPGVRDRYADEAARMSDKHDPAETI
ncbi:hypothetical protein [Haloterrigena alkaliphila]|uniref:hypothetical protein n=1 Tax=Haloterrigena alkaliphila TaxID=2816475 RepID=UPI001CFF622C|nr:hypothetical protein [Haloterrigena alkaliphila]UHQ95163.1 hypothetical protein J0X25_20185 [Haloterrigena alkaliphila]